MVTIGVPIYGVESYIERCAVSLFEQTYEDLEFVFVDDCSPDRSVEVLKEVLKNYPNREPQVKIIRHKKNIGLAAARNTAVDHATGDFLLWVDSDDYVDTTLVEQCVNKQLETESDIILFDYVMLLKNKQNKISQVKCQSADERTIKLLSRQASASLWVGFYRLSLYKDNNISAVVGVNNNEDYQVSPRLSYYSRKIAYIDKPLYFYDCNNNNSITQNFNDEYADQGWRSIDILNDFFRDKGQRYLEALKVAAVNRLAVYLKWSLKVDNREYYNDLRKRQQLIAMDMANTVPLSGRIYLYLKSYHLLKIYTSLGGAIKKLLRR